MPLELDPHLRKSQEDEGPAYLTVLVELYRLSAQEQNRIESMSSEEVVACEMLPGVRKLHFADRKANAWSSLLHAFLK